CISYYVGRRLAELFPEKAVLESGDVDFRMEPFVRDGQCSVVAHETVHCQISTTWDRPGKELLGETDNAVLSVLWNDNFLDVIVMTWLDEGCRSRRHWLLADSREVAERFFSTVCEWCTEVRGEILEFSGGRWRKNEELFRAIGGASFEDLILPASLQ